MFYKIRLIVTITHNKNINQQRLSYSRKKEVRSYSNFTSKKSHFSKLMLSFGEKLVFLAFIACLWHHHKKASLLSNIWNSLWRSYVAVSTEKCAINAEVVCMLRVNLYNRKPYNRILCFCIDVIVIAISEGNKKSMLKFARLAACTKLATLYQYETELSANWSKRLDFLVLEVLNFNYF